YFLEGDTKLFGKILNDKNISDLERKDFQNFMNINKTQSAFLASSNPNDWNPFEERLSMKLFIQRANITGNAELSKLATSLDEEYQMMINSNMSLNEFKNTYLDFKKRHDEFVNLLKAEEKMRGINNIDLTKMIKSDQTKEVKNPRTPIQSESQNKETYKDDNTKNELLKKLLENKFGKSEELELLFGIKFSDDKTGEFSKILSKNTPKSVDIKA
ncbi:hypothetical protein Q5U77_001596, partial [Campylobacter upsaliensis]|nr:hypothetical protein [Campylobacter upsaliensis]